MSITKIECWTVSCDVCDSEIEADYIMHFPSASDAKNDITNYDWWVWDAPDGAQYVWCDNCLPECVCGHRFGEHDYGNSPCQGEDRLGPGDVMEPCPCKQFEPAKKVAA